MSVFTPRLDILPPAQRRLWQELRAAPGLGFVLYDRLATKVKVILQRAEAKDYRDIAAMVQGGVSPARALASARCMFGHALQPSESLKALVYFEDGDLPTLTRDERATLVGAASAVGDLPDVAVLSKALSD